MARYVQGNIFLSRGHLAPNGDFIFSSWMDSSFHFVNVAPQWQCINGEFNTYMLEINTYLDKKENLPK